MAVALKFFIMALQKRVGVLKQHGRAALASLILLGCSQTLLQRTNDGEALWIESGIQSYTYTYSLRGDADFSELNVVVECGSVVTEGGIAIPELIDVIREEVALQDECFLDGLFDLDIGFPFFFSEDCGEGMSGFNVANFNVLDNVNCE